MDESLGSPPGPYCPRTISVSMFSGVNGPDRLQDLYFFVPHGGGIEGGRRLHGHERSELQDVALNHVARRARGFVKSGALLDAQCFGSSDLHVVHVVPVPQRLENAVAEPQYHEVLDRVFPQVMIDAVDLGFVECLENGLIQLSRRGQVAAEGFFDDDPRPGFFVWIFCQAGLRQLFNNDWDKSPAEWPDKRGGCR